MGRVNTLSLVACLMMSATLVAQDTRITPGIRSGNPPVPGSKMGHDRQQSGQECETDSCETGECPVVAKAMEALPKMVFRIGEDETCCHMTATQMAREAHEEITYVVGKKKFRDSQDAFEALVKETETYVKKSLNPTVCEESGTTFVVGQTCDCDASAAKMSELVKSSIADMKMTYAVGEKTFDKYTDARRAARKLHAKGMYVVAGEKFENEYEARLSLAHQQYRTAVTALQQDKSGESVESAPQKDKAAPNTQKHKNLPNMKIG